MFCGGLSPTRGGSTALGSREIEQSRVHLPQGLRSGSGVRDLSLSQSPHSPLKWEEAGRSLLSSYTTP